MMHSLLKTFWLSCVAREPRFMALSLSPNDHVTLLSCCAEFERGLPGHVLDGLQIRNIAKHQYYSAALLILLRLIFST
ncbi:MULTISPECIES: hypothetical protein [Bifidobacterium]|jgi:hypothetical protein|nr:hypothetical protein [Bifidobacterium tibiigranuli]MCI1220932.1 hypothetical protein [Bifidobacterium tibiigranuli]MCI1254135.1 hypothetical protein [Bifidobacterium tibiigranuli]MCI1797329.1 hypothetical protein [Bifidobacterium tibiigranuli]